MAKTRPVYQNAILANTDNAAFDAGNHIHIGGQNPASIESIKSNTMNAVYTPTAIQTITIQDGKQVTFTIPLYGPIKICSRTTAITLEVDTKLAPCTIEANNNGDLEIKCLPNANDEIDVLGGMTNLDPDLGDYV